MVMTFYLQMKGTHHIHLWACPPNLPTGLCEEKEDKNQRKRKGRNTPPLHQSIPHSKDCSSEGGKSKNAQEKNQGRRKGGYGRYSPTFADSPIELDL